MVTIIAPTHGSMEQVNGWLTYKIDAVECLIGVWFQRWLDWRRSIESARAQTRQFIVNLSVDASLSSEGLHRC